MARSLSLLLLALLTSAPALAQTCTTEWAAPIDGAWSVAANWTDGVPEPADVACITASGTYTVALGGFVGTEVATLVVGGASGTQTLTSQGYITAGSAQIRANGRLRFIDITPGGSDGLYSTGTVTVEGEVEVPGGVTFLADGGTLDVAPSGTVRVSDHATVGGVNSLFRIRGTVEGVGCPFPINTGSCTVDAPVEVLGGTVRAAEGVLVLRAGGTMNGATLDAGSASALILNADLVPPHRMTVEGLIQGSPEGTVGMSGLNLFAGPAGATLAVTGTGFQMVGTSFLRSGGGSFTNTGLLLKAATGSNFSGLAEVIVRNEGVVEIPSGLGLYAGGVLRNAPGGVVRATAGGHIAGDGNGTGRFENAGLFVLDAPDQTFSFSDGGFGRDSGPYSQPGSELRVLAGALDLAQSGPGSRVLPEGAALTGAGSVSVRGSFQPAGTVSPGTEAAPLARLVHGAYFYPAAAVSRLVIDLDTGGRSDTLDVGFAPGGSGARLAGSLILRLRPGYVPATGDAFTILRTAGTVTGQFDQVVVDGAPDGIAFVAEIEGPAGGQVVRLRAVAAAPGGPITVSTTAPVGGGVRSLFLTGPGVAGVTAARLDCTDCLDGAGSIPATLSGSATLKDARFDLTDPRAIGLYDLVIERPGQPAARAAVTVRPYIGSVTSDVLVQTGMFVRPATAPGRIHNFSPYVLRVLTNGPSAYPFVTVDRPVPEHVSMILSSAHSYEHRFYASDDAADPAEVPLLLGAVPPVGGTTYEIGLRIDPEAVLFPEQTPTGPDDDRVPFGEGQHLIVATSTNTTAERAAQAVEAGLRATGHAGLDAYLASVDAADAGAVAAAIASALRSTQLLTSTSGLLDEVLRRLDAVRPTPGGLAASAAGAFDDALRVASDALRQREAAAFAAAAAGTPLVQALYPTELAALGIEYADDTVLAGLRTARTGDLSARPPLSDACFYSLSNADAIRDNCSCEERKSLTNKGTNYSGDCVPSSGSADPNDKTADTDLICEFGTVTVHGEEETRCVRYFVPRSRATEPVAYTIHFENLPAATAPAEYVTITDEIDPNLDLSTLRIESTSSDSTFSYSVSGRTVTFRFVGIDLPPNVEAPEGEGFVRFSLRPNPGLPDGTVIRNDADIVFDFNPAIATPEVVHEIQTVSDLAALIVAPDFVTVGDPLALDLVVANLRGDPAGETTVTIQTGGLTGVTATPSAGTCTGAGPIVCALGTLDPETFEQVTLTTTTAPRGEYTITATAATAAVDGFAANDTDIRQVGVVGVAEEAAPDALREPTLAQPRPNPSAGQATLRWGLPAAGRADVRVFDLLGREVAVLVDGEAAQAGWHETPFRAAVASGVYVVRFQAEVNGQTTTQTRRMVVVR